MATFSKRRRRRYLQNLTILRLRAVATQLKVLELSDVHQTVQHIGSILPVDVMKFYICHSHAKTLTWPPKKVTVACARPSFVESFPTLCTYTVQLPC